MALTIIIFGLNKLNNVKALEGSFCLLKSFGTESNFSKKKRVSCRQEYNVDHGLRVSTVLHQIEQLHIVSKNLNLKCRY